MRFGIFYEHQLPRPWAPNDEHRLLKDAVEQVELADRLGIDYLREVEHHSLYTANGARPPGGSRSPADRPARPAPRHPSGGGARHWAPRVAGAGARRRSRIAWWFVVCAVTEGDSKEMLPATERGVVADGPV